MAKKKRTRYVRGSGKPITAAKFRARYRVEGRYSTVLRMFDHHMVSIVEWVCDGKVITDEQRGNAGVLLLDTYETIFQFTADDGVRKRLLLAAYRWRRALNRGRGLYDVLDFAIGREAWPRSFTDFFRTWTPDEFDLLWVDPRDKRRTHAVLRRENAAYWRSVARYAKQKPEVGEGWARAARKQPGLKDQWRRAGVWFGAPEAAVNGPGGGA